MPAVPVRTKRSSRNIKLEYALRYLSLGWAVIPVIPGEKKPLVDWKEYQTSLPTREEVIDWWTRYPNANLGIVTGAISGVVVVDVDSEDVWERLQQLGLVPPETPVVTTGKGYHLYFTHPGDHIPTKAGMGGIKGLDIKGDGGYVVAPPSVHPTGKMYRWGIPRGKIDERKILLGEHLLPPLPLGFLLLSRGAMGALRLDEDSDLQDILLHGVEEGRRNDSAARVVGHFLGIGLPPEEAWELTRAWNHLNRPPLEEEELRQVYDSILKRHQQQQQDHHSTREDMTQSPQTHQSPLAHPTIAKRLVEIGKQQAWLFLSTEGEGFANYQENGHQETSPIRSMQFKKWLRRSFYSTYGRPPSHQALHDALEQLDSEAEASRWRFPVYLRVGWSKAPEGYRIYIDLGDSDWRQIEVTAEGWRIVEAAGSPVWFRRTKEMLPLPEPQRGGSIQLLRQFTNTPDEEQWILLVGFIAGSFLPPDRPHPILVFNGEQGSAKSTDTRIIRALVDPKSIPLRRPPRDERDLMVAVHNNWMLAYDNLSSLPVVLSDSFSSIASGGGLGTRELFSDREEVSMGGSRPIILNGIGDLLNRMDLMDRAIVLTLPHIPESARRTEWDLEEEFKRVYPLILGGIMDMLSTGLRRLPTTKLPNLPRMADLAQWCVACGVEGFEEAYRGNRKETLAAALESDVVWHRVEELLTKHPAGWKGTPTELHQILLEEATRNLHESKLLPSSPNALSSHLRRIVPAMRQEGVEVIFTREGKSRRRVLIISPIRGDEQTS